MSTDEEDENRRKEKGEKGKASGAGAMGASKSTITPAFFEYMARIGASMEQITEILRTWTHLKGDDLRRKLADFARDPFRVSAHAQVLFQAGKDFALIHNLLRYFGGKDAKELAQKLSPEEQAKLGLT